MVVSGAPGEGVAIIFLFVGEDAVLDGFADAFSDQVSVLSPRFGQQNNEFLASITGDNVRRTCVLVQLVCQMNQYLVTSCVAVRVIDIFEIIGIQQDD